MYFDCAKTHIKLPSNLIIGIALNHQFQHFQLFIRQRISLQNRGLLRIESIDGNCLRLTSNR